MKERKNYFHITIFSYIARIFLIQILKSYFIHNDINNNISLFSFPYLSFSHTHTLPYTLFLFYLYFPLSIRMSLYIFLDIFLFLSFLTIFFLFRFRTQAVTMNMRVIHPPEAGRRQYGCTTVCPRSLDPFHTVIYYKTSRTDSMLDLI